MNDVHNIFINLISNFIWFPISALVGALVVSVFYFFQVRLPKRRLWRLANPKNLVACASNAAIMDTGVYLRPATGIGEVRAIILVVESLGRAYTGKLDIKNMLLPSDDMLRQRYENDLLLIGGPKHNKITASFLSLAEARQLLPFQQTPDAIIWKCNKIAGKWVDDGAVTYTSKVENKNIIQDYGIVVRMQSPFTSNKRTVILLSGIHTYGTIAAAKFFTEDMQKGWLWFFRLRKRNVAALVRTHIIDDYTANVELIKQELW
jgi:hypothetical protein